MVVLCAALLVLGGCGTAGPPQAVPTIGSPTPTPRQTTAAFDRSRQLAREWGLTGALLPADWPDVPLPEGAEVVTAYAIGSLPRRTWTATFTTDGGTAMDMAKPVVAALRARKYVPIAEYVGAAETNTGLYSFSAPGFAVYVVLGEDDGRPNLVLTVRGATASTGAPGFSRAQPTGSAASSTTPTATEQRAAHSDADTDPHPFRDGNALADQGLALGHRHSRGVTQSVPPRRTWPRSARRSAPPRPCA